MPDDAAGSCARTVELSNYRVALRAILNADKIIVNSTASDSHIVPSRCRNVVRLWQ
jgi:hypothetical protein